ncbi:MAG: DMT family transporter [Alphaproteobacteria bacterium]|nr:DMT family transporter [Alphaproteobacteria bacterium]
MNKSLLANLAAAAAALSAGACVVATRLVVGETDPVSLAFYRYVIGVICFLPVLPFLWPASRIRLGDYAKIAALGALFFGLFPWAFNASLQYIPAARGAIGLATIPVQTLIVAVIFGREKLTPNKIISVGLAFAGIALVFGPEAMKVSGSDYMLGDGLMLLGAFSAAIYSVFSRATLGAHGPLFVTALAMAFGVLALAPLVQFEPGIFQIPQFTHEGWIAVLFLGTFGGALQFSLFTWALRWLPPTRTVIYLTLNPISAMLLAVLLLNESLTLVLVAGLALVLAGIFAGNIPRTSSNLARQDT